MIVDNLLHLHACEEQLRHKALELINGSSQKQLHLKIIESSMDCSDGLRQFETDNEDLKVIQILAMRTFNAFAASLKLALSGYFQNSALVMRDILETAFLLDFFNSNRTSIHSWRTSDETARKKNYGPVQIRKALDTRDNYTNRKREALYKLFSELAGHATMKSDYMMRPKPDGDAVIGPFMETTALRAILDEMAKLAVQVGEKVCAFLPDNWDRSLAIQTRFNVIKREWIVEFYGESVLRSGDS